MAQTTPEVSQDWKPYEVTNIKFGDWLNVRSRPTSSAEIVATMQRVTKDVRLLQRRNEWAEIVWQGKMIFDFGEGKERERQINAEVRGWVASRFLKLQQNDATAVPNGVGYFGTPLLKPLSDGRNMMLISDFGYKDAHGALWKVPAGTETDGASIPRALWSFVGGPWEGKYRDAAIIHDRFCDTKERSWRETHTVFYEAMLTSGVEELQAKLIYFAVYRFGPRWTETGVTCYYSCAEGGEVAIIIEPEVDRSAFMMGKEKISKENLSIEEIEKLADDAFNNENPKIKGTFHGIGADGGTKQLEVVKFDTFRGMEGKCGKNDRGQDLYCPLPGTAGLFGKKD